MRVRRKTSIQYSYKTKRKTFRSEQYKHENSLNFFEGEDIDARLPQGKIRRYQNLNTKPSYVIEKCLWDLFEAVRQRRPGYTERNLRDHINWFLTHEEGYIDRRIAEIAKSEPYRGKVIPDDL